MPKTADQSVVKTINQQAIMQIMRQNHSMSRADLAKALKISKPAITENVYDLLEQGALEEIGLGEGAPNGGRKPMLLKFNENFRFIIAIDLNLKNPLCALGNMNSGIVHATLINSGGTPQERLEFAEAAIREMFTKCNIPFEKLGKIVISSPGILGKAEGQSQINPQHRPWAHINMETYLAQAFGVEVIVKNDVNLAAMGEKERGFGQDARNMVFISCGKGLGAGIMLDGQLYEGQRNAAGEIGYFVKDGLPGEQTLEQFVQMDSLISRIRQGVRLGRSTVFRQIGAAECIDFEQIVEAYDKEDDFVRGEIRVIGQQLGVAIANIASLLDLDKVVIGGQYLAFEKVLLDTIREIVTARVPYPPVIVASALRAEAGIIGAFAVGVEGVLRDINV